MKTVISASRRTDIPAFYLKWFIDAIKGKTLTVPNPLYKNKNTIVDLVPEKVAWIVFWSRNYKKFIEHVDFFNDYNLFFHFTIVSHHHHLEKTKISFSESLSQVEKLAAIFGSNRIIWRYDPIVCWYKNGEIQTNFNLEEFSYLCKNMQSYGIKSCYFSFVTNYSKFIKRFKSRYPNLTIAENQSAKYKHILQLMTDTAQAHSIHLYSCCNDALINSQIKKGHCISGELLNSISGNKIVSTAKSPGREDCGCTKSIDIGNYSQQPCYFGCIYCYANPVY